MKKKSDPFDMKLDAYEQEIADALEAGEFEQVEDVERYKKLAKEAAENYFRKDSRASFRISSTDLKSLKSKAAMEGLPYQTFIASILHKFVTGQLVPRNKDADNS